MEEGRKKEREEGGGRREEGGGKEGGGKRGKPFPLWQSSAEGCSIASSQDKRSINRMTSPPALALSLSPSLPPPPPSSLCKDSLRHVGPAPRSAYKPCVMQRSGHKRNFTHQREEKEEERSGRTYERRVSLLPCFPHIQNIWHSHSKL